MAFPLSNWKLTFDPSGTPRVLLDIGDAMADELRWPLAKGLEVVPMPAGAPFLRPNENAHVMLEYERFVVPNSLADKWARRDVLDRLITYDGLGKKPLRVEVQGLTDRYWQFANAYITNVVTRRYLISKRPVYAERFSITATVLSKTVV